MYRKNILTNNKNEYRNPKSNLIKKIIKKIKNKKSQIWSIDFMLYNFFHKKIIFFPLNH